MVKEMLCILTASVSVLVVDTVLQVCKMLPLKGPGYKGNALSWYYSELRENLQLCQDKILNLKKE